VYHILPRLFLSAKAYDIRVANLTTSSATVSFLQVPGARSYEYAISNTSAKAGFGLWTTLPSNGTITGLTTGTQYWLKTRAVNGASRGPASPVITATPISTASVTLTGVRANTGAGTFSISGSLKTANLTGAFITSGVGTLTAGGGTPPVITGSVQVFDIGGAFVDNTGTVSTAVNVPSDATMVVVGISGWKAFQNNYFSDGAMTFTKGGVDTAMIPVQSTPRADTTATGHNAAMFYMTLPDTGTNKTLKWDWDGIAGQDRGCLISAVFLKGVNTSDPVRGTGGGQNDIIPVNTGTITAATNDLIVAFLGASVLSVADGTINSWNNLTTLSNPTFNGNFTDLAWATGLPTGNTTVGAASATNLGAFCIVAISVKPS